MTAGPRLTLGPLLFNWPAGRIRDFYARIADEAPVDTVHLGEAVCSKREPFLREVLPEAAERLARSGKEVVWSTLGLIADGRDVRATRTLVDDLHELVEVNDLTALSMLDGRPCVIGPTVNIYNEGTLAWLAGRGAIRACLPPELPEPGITALAGAAGSVELELFAFGRMPLALSARCYHARAYGLHKDGCQYVCGEDPNGMPLETLDGEPFLAINGI
ncbi:MAG TPA: U32 family peptidase, partial [Alphaproteobacteria bacterium]|nr:U32 family peptidase [Alphaproteobacteria bacterium]